MRFWTETSFANVFMCDLVYVKISDEKLFLIVPPKFLPRQILFLAHEKISVRRSHDELVASGVIIFSLRNNDKQKTTTIQLDIFMAFQSEEGDQLHPLRKYMID